MPGTNKTGLILLILITLSGCVNGHQPVAPFPDVQNIAVIVAPGPFVSADDKALEPCQNLKPVIETRIINNLTKHTGVNVKTVNATIRKNVSGNSILPLQLIDNFPPKTFDCVFICIIERCTPRHGTAYAVSVPAEIGLKAFLFNLPSKKLLWQNSFFESQKSLSENLLTAKKFIQRKGKWITVRALAIEGVDSLMASLPPKSGRDK